MFPGVVVLLLGLWPGSPSAVQGPTPAVECADWRACRDATEHALTADDTEGATTWRGATVQRGPRDDAALMFLLARAQARSGRVDDALVMVRRLAQRGVADRGGHPPGPRARPRPGRLGHRRADRRQRRRRHPAPDTGVALVASTADPASWRSRDRVSRRRYGRAGKRDGGSRM